MIIQKLIDNFHQGLVIVLNGDFTSRELGLGCIPRLMPAHARRVVNWVTHNEWDILDFGVPEAIVVHPPFDLLETLDGPGSGEILEEKTGGRKEGVTGAFRCCRYGGEILEPVIKFA